PDLAERGKLREDRQDVRRLVDRADGEAAQGVEPAGPGHPLGKSVELFEEGNGEALEALERPEAGAERIDDLGRLRSTPFVLEALAQPGEPPPPALDP